MASFNKVFLMGNLTRDPELKTTGNGTSVANVGMAINRKYKDKEEVVYVDLTFWGKTAEIMAKHLSKGSPIFVDGRLQLDQWETEGGDKRSKLKVIVENFQFIGGKGGGQDSAPAASSDSGDKWPEGLSLPKDDDDDIPF